MINDSLRTKELIYSDFLMYPDNVPECVFSYSKENFILTFKITDRWMICLIFSSIQIVCNTVEAIGIFLINQL